METIVIVATMVIMSGLVALSWHKGMPEAEHE